MWELTKTLVPQDWRWVETPLAVPAGVVVLVIIVLGFVAWKFLGKFQRLRRELEQERAKPPAAARPQQPTPRKEVAIERVPEKCVEYVVECAGWIEGDPARSIFVGNPRCSAHPGEDMAQTGNWRWPTGWQCNVCKRNITQDENKRFRCLANTAVLKRIQPETVAV